MDKFLAVTRFKADDVHLNIEQLGDVQNQLNRPGPTLAKKILDQVKPNADINPTHSICDKVNDTLGIGGNGKLGGIFDAVNSDIGSNSAWVKSQINDVKSLGESMYGGGISGCNFKAASPPNIIDNLQSSVFGQARNLSRLNFNLDSMLLGSDLRSMLLRNLNSLCGTSLTDPFGDMLKGMSDLLGILDNVNLFSNSDLFSAIGKCKALQPEHSKILSHKTSNLARTGNAKAIKDVLTNIPDTKIMSNDIPVLCNTSADTSENAKDILNILNTTNRSVDDLISEKVTNNLDNIKPTVSCTSIQKINFFNNKPTLVKSLLNDSNLTINSKSKTKHNPAVLNRVSELMTPVQIKTTEKGKVITQTTTQEKIILKNNIQKIFSGITEHRKNEITKLTSLNKRPDIDFGIQTPSIDFSSIQGRVVVVSTKSTMGLTWGNAVTEVHSQPSINNFINPKEDSLLFVNQPSLAYVEKEVVDKEVILNQLKKDQKINVLPYNKIQTFGTNVEITKSPINSWKRIKQDDGHEVRFAVY